MTLSDREIIIGVDEVGFGSIAGPMVVTAVAFVDNTEKPVLTTLRQQRVVTKPVKDSKLIPRHLMPQFEECILKSCVDHVTLTRPAWEIDKHGIKNLHTDTVWLCISRLLEKVCLKNTPHVQPATIIIDGHMPPNVPTIFVEHRVFTIKAQPKADRDIWQVSCASILAKNQQLKEMTRLHTARPEYGWDKNHGYGTAAHYAAIARYGLTRHHRKTFSLE